MSTNKTQNYKLHSWEPTDHFLRSEVNENFAALDAALQTEAQRADQALKAETSARNAAVTALETALRSQLQKTDAAVAGKAEIVLGAYTGDGEDPHTITLGFRPQALHLEADMGARSTGYSYFSGGLLPAESITDTGFIAPPALNGKGRNHVYMAFR